MEKKNKDQIIIKHKSLDDVLKDCHEHIVKLLRKSKSDFDAKDYVFCVIETILALEEIGKYEVFGKYLRELKDVPLWEMEKLTGHGYKLTVITDMELKRETEILKNKTKGEIEKTRKQAEYHKFQYRTLNIVKQLAMYYNYDKGYSVTLEKHFMKNEITENYLGHFCLGLIELANYTLLVAVLRKQCGNVDGIIDINSPSVKNNQNYKHILEDTERIKTERYQPSLHKFQSTLLELEKLVSYLKNE